LAKFIFSLGDRCFETIKAEAEARGIKVQQLIRAVIIPDWIRQNQRQGPSPRHSDSGENSPISHSPVGRLPSNASNMQSRRGNGESALEPSPTITRARKCLQPVKGPDASRRLIRNRAIGKDTSRILTNLSSKNLNGEKATSSS
jgi:hypothetical protein